MQYQLVLQFTEEIYGDIDWIANMEDFLESTLTLADIDGYDIGRGEVNLFLDTNAPEQAFDAIKTLFENQDSRLLEDCKVGYRDFNKPEFVQHAFQHEIANTL